MAKITAQHEAEFPNLATADYEKTSDADPFNNCVAWAAGDKNRRWDPTVANAYWPANIPRGVNVATFVRLFAEELRYEVCNDGALEEGYEKIAIYETPQKTFGHVALQTEVGQWTSKLGDWEDIRHALPESLASGWYGSVCVYMRRKRP